MADLTPDQIVIELDELRKSMMFHMQGEVQQLQPNRIHQVLDTYNVLHS